MCIFIYISLYIYIKTGVTPHHPQGPCRIQRTTVPRKKQTNEGRDEKRISQHRTIRGFDSLTRELIAAVMITTRQSEGDAARAKTCGTDDLAPSIRAPSSRAGQGTRRYAATQCLYFVQSASRLRDTRLRRSHVPTIQGLSVRQPPRSMESKT